MEVRTRIFQYKINTNCLLTNYRLHKMKLVDSELCTFCVKFPETVNHIFWECEYVRPLWSVFIDWYRQLTNIYLSLNIEYILFCFKQNRSDLFLNHCMILMKKMIYDSRYRKQKPQFRLFIQLVEFNFSLEKQIAKQNNTMGKFLIKWQKYLGNGQTL